MFAVALTQRQSDGIAHRPGAWSATVGRRTALNRLRRSSTEAVKLQEVAMRTAPPEWKDPPIPMTGAWRARWEPAAVTEGLNVVDQLDSAGVLTGYHLVPATRADLLRRRGRHREAARRPTGGRWSWPPPTPTAGS